MKACGDCGTEKAPTDFNKNPNTRDGLNTYCRPCGAARMRVWRAKNVESVRLRERDGHLRRAYGLTAADYEAKLAAQGGVCDLCGRSAEEAQGVGRSGSSRNLCVDHDHAAGQVRGLLCSSCNQAVAAVERDPLWGMRALAYLDMHTENRMGVSA